jgi:hypothetical protein
MALLQLSDYKAIAGLPATPSSSDTQYNALILAASQVIKTYCKRDLESNSYTEYYSGNNTQRLVLRQTPVTAITNVWLDNSGYFGTNPLGSFDSTSLLILGTDYTLDLDTDGVTCKSGILFRLGTVWPVVTRLSRIARLTPDAGPAYGNIKVAYTAGYNPIPEDLQVACVLLVNLMKSRIPLGQYIISEKLGAYTYQLLKSPPSKFKDDVLAITSLLAPYLENPW